MPNPITNPVAATYASRSPYITAAEYLASPTGVDVSQLVVGQNEDLNEDALNQTIARASSWIDTECQQVLGATLDTQAGMFRIKPDGTIKIPLDNTPVLQIVGVSLGSTFQSIEALDDLTGVWPGRKVATIPVSGYQFGGFAGPRTGSVFAVVEYVNGFANSLLTEDSMPGDTTLEVDTALGIIPGLQLTIYDPGATETVIVAAVAGSTVTLVAGLQSGHAAGTNVSALPPAVKQAAVLKTSALIKTRGADSYVMPMMGAEPAQTNTGDSGAGDDGRIAAMLLAPFRRVA